MRSARAALVALALLLAACSTSRVLWRDGALREPLAADAPIAFYVRSSAPDDLRAGLLARGATAVSVAPDGTRVAEMGFVDNALETWDGLLDRVRRAARDLGADRVVATGTLEGTGERVVLFQFVTTVSAR